ncbi:MAG: flagellar biosynthetic protein FliO [Balneolaceae bacterium]
MDFDKFRLQLKRNPRKTLRFVTGFSVTLIVLWLLVLIQTNSWKNEGYVDIQNIEKISGQVSEAEPEIRPEPDIKLPEKRSSAPGYGMVFFLLIVTGGSYFFLKNKTPDKSGLRVNPNFDVLETIQVSENNALVLAQVNGEYWILSSGDSGLHILKSFKRTDWKKVKMKDEPEAVKKPVFSELLHRFQHNGTVLNGTGKKS